MQYTRFKFQNFKGIESMTLDLTGDVTTLIGLNESGKTTILEAIFCFSYGAEDLEAINPEMASLRVPDQWIPISQRANFNDKIEIRAAVRLSSDDKRALRNHMRRQFGLALSSVQDEIEIAEIYRFENSRFDERERTWNLHVAGTKGKQRNQRPYGAQTEEWHSAVAFLRGRLPRIWYFPNFLFDLPERFALVQANDEDAGDEEADKSQFYRSTFEEILEQLGSGANLETHVVERLKSEDRADQRSLNSLLLDMSRVLTTTIFEGWDRIFGSRPAAQEVELAAEAEGDDAYLELKIKGPDGYYDLSERSLGFRWFFMFLMMTSFHGLAKDGPRSLFLLDEPASNLHSTAQAELLKSFENLVTKCHLVYTTHSHHLINVRWLDASYVVKNSALGSLDFADYVTQRMGANTSISATPYRQFVAANPDQTSYFQPVLDLLDYRPSLLEPMPDVVLVEGKTDFYLLRYATDILQLPTTLRFVPGGGAGTLEPLIRLHIGWGKSFVVLLDGDKEGLRQKARYADEFGPFVEDRCLLLPNLCGSERSEQIESLLDTDARERIIAAIYEPGVARPTEKKAFNQAIRELYARQQTVDIGTAATTRITTLLERLTEALAQQSAK